MPGMLTENVPSSGPTAPTPAAATPGAGAPPSDGKAPGSGQPVDVEALKEKAVRLVYGDRFEQLIKMFQNNGPENFARSMAVAVNTAISEIEKEQGPIGPEAAAEIGADLFPKLLEDMLVKPKDGMGSVVEGVTPEQLQQVMPAILVMYADSHPDVSKQDVQAVMAEVDSQTKEKMGGEQQPASPTTTATAPPVGGPAPPPAGSIPPGRPM